MKVKLKILYGVISLLLAFGIYYLIIIKKTDVAIGFPIPKMLIIKSGKLTTLACPEGIDVCPFHDYEERLLEIDAFEVSETEVTFAQWDACVDDGACVNPLSTWAYKNRPVVLPCVENEVCQYPSDEGWGRGSQPVINVSWNDVQKYLTWLNKKTGKKFRLLSSQEWEYVALANTNTLYYWGDSLGSNNTNCNGCGTQWDNKQTAPVGSFKTNPFGVYDMLGNVSEWVSSCFPSRKEGSQECNSYIYRGGAWSYSATKNSMDPRNYYSNFPQIRANYVGFRIGR